MRRAAGIAIQPGAEQRPVSIREAATEEGWQAVTLSEAGAIFDDAKREIIIRPIKTGFGNARDGFYYTKGALQEAVNSGVFKNRKMFANHPTQDDERARPERSVWDWVSTLKEAWWDDATDEARARIKVYDDRFWDRARQAPDEIAFSILGGGLARAGVAEGRKARIVESLTKIKSVDWVTEAGAGGGLVAFAESAREELEMDLGTLTLEQLRDSRPDLLEEALSEAEESEDVQAADDSTEEEADVVEEETEDSEEEEEAPETTDEDEEEAEDTGVTAASTPDDTLRTDTAVTESESDDDDDDTEENALEARIATLEKRLREADLREAAGAATKKGHSIVESLLKESTLPGFAKDQIKARFAEAQVGEQFAWPSDDILRRAIKNEIKLTTELVGKMSDGRKSGATSIGGEEPVEISSREAVSAQLSDMWGVDDIPQRATKDDDATETVKTADEQPVKMSEAGVNVQSEMDAKFAEWSV